MHLVIYLDFVYASALKRTNMYTHICTYSLIYTKERETGKEAHGYFLLICF